MTTREYYQIVSWMTTRLQTVYSVTCKWNFIFCWPCIM